MKDGQAPPRPPPAWMSPSSYLSGYDCEACFRWTMGGLGHKLRFGHWPEELHMYGDRAPGEPVLSELRQRFVLFRECEYVMERLPNRKRGLSRLWA